MTQPQIDELNARTRFLYWCRQVIIRTQRHIDNQRKITGAARR